MTAISEARKAQIELEAAIQKLIAEYEEHWDLSVQDIKLNHRLMMGYPRRVLRVLVTVQL